MKRIAVVLGIALGGLAAVVLGRAASLESRQVEVAPAEGPAVDAEAAARRLAAGLRFRTLSHFDPSRLDAAAFLAYQELLAETYPAAHAALRRERVASHSLLYTWPGRDPEAAPLLLLAHQDVVPAAADAWTHPPFEGVIADGYVWGRGAMDDKGNLHAILEAVEHLARRGVAPRRTVLLAFGHDEEVGGEGAQAVAALLDERGVEPFFVLDEGMAVVEEVLPGLQAPVALVGVAEKGYVSVELRVRGAGGHSSTPPPHTAVGILATAIHRLEREPMPARLEGASRQLFAYLASELPLPLRTAFANLWLFEPLVISRLEGNPATNAVVRTTTAPTMIEGSPKDNVLPSEAWAVVNFRILPGDTVEGVVEHVRRVVDDSRVEIAPIRTPREPSPVSDPGSAAFAALQRTIGSTFPEALVAPGLVLGGTDARHYHRVADDVFRFGPYVFGPGDLGRVHGIDERVSVAGHARAIRFYVQLLEGVAGAGAGAEGGAAGE